MRKIIKEICPDNCNDEVKKDISERFKDMMWQVLMAMEIALPHKKGDGTDNEKRYNIIRQRVLRIGNDNVRDLEDIFNSFVGLKVYEYKKQINPNIQTDIVNFKNKIEVNKGGKDG